MSEYIGWCEVCEKRLYTTRKSARKAIKEARDGRMRPYRCSDQPDMFHVGHLPQRVRTGDVTVAEHYRRGEES